MNVKKKHAVLAALVVNINPRAAVPADNFKIHSSYLLIIMKIFAESKSSFERSERVKERKTPARGVFTPSKQPAGRSLFETQVIFRPLRRSSRALPLTHELFEKVRSKLPAIFFNKNREISELARKFTFILPKENHHSRQSRALPYLFISSVKNFSAGTIHLSQNTQVCAPGPSSYLNSNSVSAISRRKV